MKSYVSSVIYREDGACFLRVPKYLCQSVGIPDGVFFANLFVRQDVPNANRLEIVIAPFRRSDLSRMYNVRMRLKNESGSTHKMLSVLKDPRVFGMNVHVINGIDAACSTSGEVEVIGAISETAALKKMVSGDYMEIFAVNESIGDRAEGLLHKFPPVPAVSVSDEGVTTDFGPAESARFYVHIDRCFHEAEYPTPLPFPVCCDDLPIQVVGEEDDEYFLLRLACDKCVQETLQCAQSAFGLGTEGNGSASYTFVTIRLDSERNALAVLLKPPAERIYIFKLTFKPDANLAKITDVLSTQWRFDFRSISSVISADRSVIVDIAANVTGSRFDGIHPSVMEQLLRLRNETEDLKLKNIRIEKVFQEEGRTYPTDEEELDLFRIHSFALMRTVGVPATFVPQIEKRPTLPLPHEVEYGREMVACCKEICKTIADNGSITQLQLVECFTAALSGVNLSVDAEDCLVARDHVRVTAADGDSRTWQVCANAKGAFVVSYSGQLDAEEVPLRSGIVRLMADTCNTFRLEEEVSQALCNRLFRLSLPGIVSQGDTVLSVKKLLGRYNLTKKLGSGHFGTVYKAFDDESAEWRALKLTETELSHTEFKILLDVRHPRLLEYLDFVQVEDNWVISMELLHGTTLEDVLADKVRLRDLPMDERLEIMKRVLDGIKALHDVGIVHLDIKPDNLMLLDTGDVKILDFGLAGSVKAQQFDFTISRRNAAYVAPEFHRKDKESIHYWTDIFALGVVFYELLFGTHPYPSYADYHKGIGTKPEAVDLTRQVALRFHKFSEFFQKSLALNHLERYKDVAQMEQGLTDALK